LDQYLRSPEYYTRKDSVKKRYGYWLFNLI
jgi:hypothetical protein